MNNSSNTNNEKQILHLLKLINGANKDIEIGLKRKDDFMVRQYQHLKNKFVKELDVLLASYQLKLEIKAA